MYQSELDDIVVSDGGYAEIYSMCQISGLSVGDGETYTSAYCGFTSTVLGSSARFWGSHYCEYEGFSAGECASISICNTCGMSDVTIGAGGYLYLSRCCSVTGLNFPDGGSARICDSCRLADVRLGPGATMTVSQCSEIENVRIASGGSLLVSSGQCRVGGVTVGAGGYLSLAGDASAVAVTSSEGAVVDVAEGAYIDYSTTEEEGADD